jgi:uncharacterized membrane protein
VTVTWYSLLKYLHVLLAITAVGSNIGYGIWKGLAARGPNQEAFVTRGVSFIDNRVANPAYGLLLITGLTLVVVGNWGLRGWIITALILFAVLIVIAVGFYARVLRQQLQVIDREGTESPTFKRLEGQATTYGLISLVIVLAIIFMMVVKPFP